MTSLNERSDATSLKALYPNRLPKRKIRLLSITGWRWPFRTRFRLEEHNAAHMRDRYNALSYVWGTDIAVKPIFINGVPVNVTQNLFDFLTVYSSRRDRVPLWIDALCINQIDEVEKTQQVKRMGSIYSHAKLVIVWLGPDNSVTGKFLRRYISSFETVDALTGQFFAGRAWNIFTFTFTVLRYWIGMILGLLLLCTPNTHLVAELLGNPWFERVWTLQEYVLARNPVFWYGKTTFSSRTLTTVAESGTSYDARLPKDRAMRHTFSNLELIKERYGQGKLSANELLWKVRHRKATDARDKLFGLCGIWLYPSIVDYSRTLSETLIYYAKLNIDHEINVTDFLSYSTHAESHQPVDGLPSWVPTWAGSRDEDHSFLWDTSSGRSLGSSSPSVQICSGNVRYKALLAFKFCLTNRRFRCCGSQVGWLTS